MPQAIQGKDIDTNFRGSAGFTLRDLGNSIKQVVFPPDAKVSFVGLKEGYTAPNGTGIRTRIADSYFKVEREGNTSYLKHNRCFYTDMGIVESVVWAEKPLPLHFTIAIKDDVLDMTILHEVQ